MKKVLLVDDESDIREVFKAILECEGYSVVAAESGELGLECLAKDTFDLIMVDKKMPAMDGLEFIKRVRGQNLPIKIILITGSISDPVYAGVDICLAKPCGIDQLLEAVKQLLGS